MANSFVYQQVFGGANIYPSDITYRAINLTTNITLDWPLEAAPSGDNPVARIMDVNCTVQGAVITMPDARNAGLGITTLFNNVGTQSFIVKVNSGTTQIAQVPSGSSGLVQIYLVDNSTVSGLWKTVNYGSSAAPAQASILAGNGLIARGSTLATAVNVEQLDAEGYTFGVNDRAVAFVWVGSGATTLNLPEPPTVADNWYILIRNASQGLVTVDPLGNYQINGQPTLDLRPGDSCIIITDGLTYYTIGFGQSAKFAFDYVAINLGTPAPATYTLSGEFLNRIAYGFTGGLGADISIIVPTNKQQYWISNATSGNYNFYVRTEGQSTASAPIIVQNQKSILYCDGTQVVRANDNNVPTPIPITQGGTGATTKIGAQISLGATSLGQSLFTVPNAETARNLIGVVDTSSLALIYAIALGG